MLGGSVTRGVLGGSVTGGSYGMQFDQVGKD